MYFAPFYIFHVFSRKKLFFYVFKMFFLCDAIFCWNHVTHLCNFLVFYLLLHPRGGWKFESSCIFTHHPNLIILWSYPECIFIYYIIYFSWPNMKSVINIININCVEYQPLIWHIFHTQEKLGRWIAEQIALIEKIYIVCNDISLTSSFRYMVDTSYLQNDCEPLESIWQKRFWIRTNHMSAIYWPEVIFMKRWCLFDNVIQGVG